MIDTAVHPIPGLGELYVYDTALRIGAKLNLFPDKAYLHAGTRSGARALGLDARAEALAIKDLPTEFHVLKPHEIEDVLCIFKNGFREGQNHAKPPPFASSRKGWGIGTERKVKDNRRRVPSYY